MAFLRPLPFPPVYFKGKISPFIEKIAHYRCCQVDLYSFVVPDLTFLLPAEEFYTCVNS